MTDSLKLLTADWSPTVIFFLEYNSVLNISIFTCVLLSVSMLRCLQTFVTTAFYKTVSRFSRINNHNEVNNVSKLAGHRSISHFQL